MTKLFKNKHFCAILLGCLLSINAFASINSDAIEHIGQDKFIQTDVDAAYAVYKAILPDGGFSTEDCELAQSDSRSITTQECEPADLDNACIHDEID